MRTSIAILGLALTMSFVTLSTSTAMADDEGLKLCMEKVPKGVEYAQWLVDGLSSEMTESEKSSIGLGLARRFTTDNPTKESLDVLGRALDGQFESRYVLGFDKNEFMIKIVGNILVGANLIEFESKVIKVPYLGPSGEIQEKIDEHGKVSRTLYCSGYDISNVFDNFEQDIFNSHTGAYFFSVYTAARAGFPTNYRKWIEIQP